jgi:hypothetical protein
MSSEDYLIRQFRLLGKVLAAILGFREKQQHQQALDEIDLSLTTWFKTDPDTLNNASDDELQHFFDKPSLNLETERSLAELLYLRTITLLDLKKNEEAIRTARVALYFFKTIDLKGGSFSFEIQERIALLDEILTKLY